MKKSLLLSVLPLTFALMVSTPSITWGADDEEIKIEAKPSWFALGKASQDRMRELQGIVDGRKRDITRLRAELKASEQEQERDAQKGDINLKASNASELFGRLETYCLNLLAEDGDDSLLKLLGGMQDGSLRAATASKNASTLLGYLQEISIRVPSPQNRGDLTVFPFEGAPTELKVGQNLFIPGICVEGSARKILDIKHVREDGVSYWTLSNGGSGGNAINDRVEIESNDYNVVVFKGTDRRPDGSTLILLPAPASSSSRDSYFFKNILADGDEVAQVNCNAAGSGSKVAYPLSTAKEDDLEIIIPGSIVSGLSIVSKYANQVSDIRQLAPVYTMIVNGVTKLKSDIDALYTRASDIIGAYEKL